MKLLDILVSRIEPVRRRLAQLNDITKRLDDLQIAVGRIEKRLSLPIMESLNPLLRYEFKVFSQWGEDGIIQYLVHSLPVAQTVFVEFGVHDYRESNTRFLLQNDNWSGLVMDSSAECIEIIKRDPLSYRYTLKAVCAYVTRENVNTVLRDNGISGDIGLLSIDIDGNDYWVWDAIDCISPRIVICEYDSLLGAERKLTTPYDPTFDRLKAHYSFLYGGASIAALHDLGLRKGYRLVGSNSAGNNAFFVRSDLLGSLRALSPQEAYIRARFRHSLDPEGHFTFLDFDQCLEVIADMPLLDLASNTLIPVRDIRGGF